MKNTIKDFLKSEEYIPSRFAAWNTVLLGCGYALLGSKKVWIKAACVVLEGVSTYAMNREMAKFMECVLYYRRKN